MKRTCTLTGQAAHIHCHKRWSCAGYCYQSLGRYGSRPICRKHQHPTTNLKRGTDNLHPCSLHELDYSVRAGKGSKRTAKNERQVDISFFLRSTALSSRTSPLLRIGHIFEILSPQAGESCKNAGVGKRDFRSHC